MKNWTANDIPDQTGRVILITGANSGLGYESALALAKKNATVVMAVRNTQKGEQARDAILQQVPGATLDLMALDLGSLDNVRSFADAFRAKYDRLDVLMNNAGVMALPYRETVDGFEMQFGVNHLGHFALTGHLLDMIINTPNSRIHTVSSSAHQVGQIHFDDLNMKDNYSRYGAYSQSKIANIYFTFELQRRLDAAGHSVICTTSDPGLANTNLQTTTADNSGSLWERTFYPLIMNTLAHSSHMGALTQLYPATAPGVKGSTFVRPRWRLRGYPTVQKPIARTFDKDIARRLWDVSEQMTGVVYDFSATPVAEKQPE